MINKIEMVWIESKNQWHMIWNGKTIQEFFDCPTLPKFFDDLDKSKRNAYLIKTKKVINGLVE